MSKRENRTYWIDLVLEVVRKYRKKGTLDYSLSNNWYQTNEEYDPNKTDVFYILSTTLKQAKDKNGKNVLCSTLSEEDKKIMREEYDYMSNEIFDAKHFNFVSPYYHQMTFETYGIEDKRIALPALKKAVNDVLDAFEYYVKYINRNRPFIIAGFSQGGVISQALLVYMKNNAFSRVIATYSIGFQIMEKELKSKRIKPATSKDDLGVIISYNSVASTDTMWDLIEGKAATCINPLNWRTDSKKAKLKYDGDEALVHVDQEHQVLVVEGLDPNKYDGMGYPIEKGVYHMWDPRFYAKEIKANAILRTKLFKQKYNVK